MPKGFGIFASPCHTFQCGLLFAGQGKEQALEAYDNRIVGQEHESLLEERFGLLPLSLLYRDLRGEVEGIFVAGALGTPLTDPIGCEIQISIPHIDLNDAVADGAVGMIKAPPLIDFSSEIEQTDVGKDGAEAIVGVRKIFLQGESALEF